MKNTSTFTTVLKREIPLPRMPWPKLTLPRVLKQDGRLERFLILIYALLTVLFGYGLLVMPDLTLRILQSGAFGSGATPGFMLRLAGALLGGLGITLLCLVPMTAPEVRRRIAVGLYVTTSVLFYFQGLILWRAGGSFATMVLTLALLVITGLLAAIMKIHLQGSDGLQQRWQAQIQEAAAQQERNRLARDLHDSIKQQIFSIRVASATVEARWATDPQGAQEALAHVRKSAQEAAVEMQALLHQLRPEPLANAGLVEALREQCEALGYRTGARVEVEIGEIPPDEQLPPSAQEELFRVAQEALSNVARHARASQVHVRLGTAAGNGALELEVRDDGRGFDPAQTAAGMGLRNMRDRLKPLGGSLEIENTAGSGTRLAARLPLTGARAQAQPPRVEEHTEEMIRRTASWALGMACFGAVIPLVPNREVPLAFFGSFALVPVLISLARLRRFRSDDLAVGTALPRAFALCLTLWSAIVGLHEPYPDSIGFLNNRTFNLVVGLPALGLLAAVVLGSFRRMRRTPEATRKGRHIGLGILVAGFCLSLPWITLSSDPYTVTGLCMIAASLFYMLWWMRDNL